MYTGKYTRIHTRPPQVWSPRDPPLHLRAGKKELEKWAGEGAQEKRNETQTQPHTTGGVIQSIQREKSLNKKPECLPFAQSQACPGLSGTLSGFQNTRRSRCEKGLKSMK